jgi:hypothetical protein
MNEKDVVGEVEVKGVELIELGDATVETRQQHPIVQTKDSVFTWTYFGSEE